MKKNVNITFNNIVNEINDINKLVEIQNLFNESCNKRKEILEVRDIAKNLEIPSYLYIKESFENMSENLIKSSKGRKLIGKYINIHKSNKDINKLYQVYENLSKADKTINVIHLIQEMKNIIGTINNNSLNDGTEKLKNILKEAYVVIGKDAKDMLSENKNPNLPDYVNYVFTNDLKMDNVVTYNKCINEIKSYVDNNAIKDVRLKSKKMNIEESYRRYFDFLNSDEISDESLAIINEIKDGKDIETFEKYKTECINVLEQAINSNIEQEVCDKLYEFKDKIANKVFDKQTLGADISNFIELKDLIK